MSFKFGSSVKGLGGGGSNLSRRGPGPSTGLNIVPVSGQRGTLPLSMKGAPNGTTATEVHRRL